MKYIIDQKQLKKTKNLIQGLINSKLDSLREESEEWGMGEMDELHEVQSVDKIKINYITLSDKIKVYVDIYKSQNRSDFDNIRAEIQYRIEDLLPNIELYINDIIDEREFGPGIDW
jgi:type I restriction-modification system DNA methylase subunit